MDNENPQDDILKEMWEMQAQLNKYTLQNNGFEYSYFDIPNDKKLMEQWVKNYTLAMRQECSELYDSTNWKWWRTKVDLFDEQLSRGVFLRTTEPLKNLQLYLRFVKILLGADQVCFDLEDIFVEGGIGADTDGRRPRAITHPGACRVNTLAGQQRVDILQVDGGEAQFGTAA